MKFSSLFSVGLALIGLAVFAAPAEARRPPAGTWQYCAGEGQICNASRGSWVRFGAGWVFVTLQVNGPVRCDTRTFGDPLYGRRKHCEVLVVSGPPAPPPTPGYDGWEFCASEGQTCRVRTATQVRFGADGYYVYRNIRNSIRCDVYTFGDPLPGRRKTCEAYYGGGGGGSSRGWEDCASENQWCNFSGRRTVRYGASGRFVQVQANNGVWCGNETFGDPAPGYTKSCQVWMGR